VKGTLPITRFFWIILASIGYGMFKKERGWRVRLENWSEWGVREGIVKEVYKKDRFVFWGGEWVLNILWEVWGGQPRFVSFHHLRSKRYNGRQMSSLFILADSPFSRPELHVPWPSLFVLAVTICYRNWMRNQPEWTMTTFAFRYVSYLLYAVNPLTKGFHLILRSNSRGGTLVQSKRFH